MFVRRLVMATVSSVWLLLTTSLAAQPFWISSDGSYDPGDPYFVPQTGRLFLPVLRFLPTQGEADLFSNVELQLEADGKLAVTAFENLSPEVICTADEINAVIARMSVSSTHADITASLTCPASITRPQEAVDVDLGRLTVLQWSVDNGYSPFAKTSAVGATGNPALAFQYSDSALTEVTLPASRPFLSTLFREDQLLSYTFADDSISSITFCDEATMLESFSSLQAGQTLTQVNDTLGCPGTLSHTTVNAEGETQTYHWLSIPMVATTVGAGFRTDLFSGSTTITGILEQGAVIRIGLRSSQLASGTTTCSVEQLTNAANSITNGMSESSVLAAVSCEPGSRLIDLASDGSESIDYFWSTSNPVASFLSSANRTLAVTLVNGVVDAVRFTRH